MASCSGIWWPTRLLGNDHRLLWQHGAVVFGAHLLRLRVKWQRTGALIFQGKVAFLSLQAAKTGDHVNLLLHPCTKELLIGDLSTHKFST